MPYTVRAAAVASDHAVIAKAIDVWMAVPENAVGLSSPTLDQVKKALADHFNEMFEAAVNARNFEGRDFRPSFSISSRRHAMHLPGTCRTKTPIRWILITLLISWNSRI